MNDAMQDTEAAESKAVDEARIWARVQPTWRGYLMAFDEILEEELAQTK